MFEIERKGAQRVDLRIAGRIESEDMREALDALVAAADDVESGQMLYEITDFEFPSAAAIVVEVSRLPALLKLMQRFTQVAVVADAGWIRTVSELEGALFPGLTIKAFETRDAAEAWLGEAGSG